MDNKKKFNKPELEVIEFNNEDIILTSAQGQVGDPDPKQGDINGWWQQILKAMKTMQMRRLFGC